MVVHHKLGHCCLFKTCPSDGVLAECGGAWQKLSRQWASCAARYTAFCHELAVATLRPLFQEMHVMAPGGLDKERKSEMCHVGVYM